MAMRFEDFDEMAAAFRDVDVDFARFEPGEFDGRLTIAELSTATVQFGCQSRAIIGRGLVDPSKSMFFVPLRCPESCILCGQPVDENMLIAFRPGTEQNAFDRGGTEYALIDLATPELQRWMVALTDRAPGEISGTCQFLRPDPASMHALRQTLSRARLAAEAHPGPLQTQEARRGLEQSIVTALVTALATHNGSPSRSAQTTINRTSVIARAEDYLEAHLDEPVYLADLCTATGVSARALHLIFRQFYNVSPMRYLKIRRLNQARRALRLAESHRATVTQVAARFGFWEMGRFAVEYRRMFGETPSQTLHGNNGRAAASLAS